MTESTQNPTTTQPSNVIIIDIDSDPLKAETFMEWSILNTLCCLCTGSIVLLCSLPAMCFSLKTRELNENHEYVEARNASILARNCNFFSSMFIIYCLIMTVVLTNMWHRTYNIVHHG